MVCLVDYIAFELCLGCYSDVVGYVYLLVVYFVDCLLLLVCLGHSGLLFGLRVRLFVGLVDSRCCWVFVNSVVVNLFILCIILCF